MDGSSLVALHRQGSLLLAYERLVDVGDDTTTGNGRLDQRVQLLVSPDGQLEMARRYPLHLQVLGGVTSQLQHLSGEILSRMAEL